MNAPYSSESKDIKNTLYFDQWECPNDINDVGNGQLDRFTEFLKKLEHLHFSETDMGKMEVAFIEAVANAINYGNKETPDLPVYIKLSADEEKLVVQVQDNNPIEFHPETAFNSVADENLIATAEHGRGLTIMRAAFDEVRYTFKNPGNQVEMVKFSTQKP
jgi:serine/threonine-protein kinase RsbW